MKLIIVDIQPEYESNTTFDIGDMLRKAAEDYSQVLVLFNGEDTLGMISESALKNFYLEKLDYDEEVFDELLSKSTFFDKGYGFFRDVMDSSVCFDRSSIIKIVKHMIDNNIQDIRELEEEDINAIGVDELLFDDLEDYGFWVPELADELPNWSGSDLAGGARNECMAEVEILGAAQGLSFNHVDDFIYEGENRYNGIMSESTLLREYIRELLTESINPKIMELIDRMEEKGWMIRVRRDSVTLFDPKTLKIYGKIGWDLPGDYESDYGECFSANMIVSSEADSGLGPILYDVAIEIAGNRGLMSDRYSVSNEATAVWDYYMKNRSDVQFKQLDNQNNELTPEYDDNCDQKVSERDPGEGSEGWDSSALSKVYFKNGTPVIDELRKRGMIKE